jgi:hypothetical protein
MAFLPLVFKSRYNGPQSRYLPAKSQIIFLGRIEQPISYFPIAFESSDFFVCHFEV